MAWISKNSAGAVVERRAEPYLTQAMKDKLAREIIPRYQTRLGALLPTLHEVQHAHGWLPAQALEEIAAFLQLKPAEVLDTASFYEEYWLKPHGKHLIQVCRSIACEMCGQKDLTDAIKEHLNIEVGETTEDGRFTLVELECLGACGGAPCCLVDEKLHEHVSTRDVGAILKSTGQDANHHHH